MIKAIVNGSVEYKTEKTPKNPLLNGEAVKWDLVKTGPNRYHVLFNTSSYIIEVISAEISSKIFELKINNKKCHVQLKDQYDDLLHELGMDAPPAGKVMDIKAPMPGLVVGVRVENGQHIKKGEAVVVLEAMKMENILKAGADAIVKSVKVKKGSKVEKNEVLVTLQ